MLTAKGVLAVLKLIKGLGISEVAEDFLIPESRLREIIEILSNKGLLIVDDKISATFNQKLSLIYLSLDLGATLEEISRVLSWRDFEDLVAYILEENGYKVKRHVILPKRREIDVIALKGDFCLSIDCKQWKRNLYPAMLMRIIREQIDRSRVLAEVFSIKETYPLIVTLLEWKKPFLMNVPIVPINKLRDFLSMFEGLRQEIFCIRRVT